MLLLLDDVLRHTVRALSEKDANSFALCSRQCYLLARRNAGVTGDAVDAVLALGDNPSKMARKRAFSKLKKLAHISSGIALFAIRTTMCVSGVSAHALAVLDARHGGALFCALLTAIAARNFENVQSALRLQHALSGVEFSDSKLRARLKRALSTCVVLSNDAYMATLFMQSVEVNFRDAALAVRSGRHRSLAILKPREHCGPKRRVLPWSFLLTSETRHFVGLVPR